MLQCICLKLHNVQESRRVGEDAGEGAGLGGPGSPQSLQEAGKAWVGMNAGHSWSFCDHSWRIGAPQQEQDTSDGVGQVSVQNGSKGG